MPNDLKPIKFLHDDPRFKYLEEKGCLFFEAKNLKTKEPEYYCYFNKYNEIKSLSILSFDNDKSRFITHHLSDKNELISFKSINEIVNYAFEIYLKQSPILHHFNHLLYLKSDELMASLANGKIKKDKRDLILFELQVIAFAKFIYVEKTVNYCFSLSKSDQFEFVKSLEFLNIKLKIDSGSNTFRKVGDFYDEAFAEAFVKEFLKLENKKLKSFLEAKLTVLNSSKIGFFGGILKFIEQ